jgi:hypothetical protein
VLRAFGFILDQSQAIADYGIEKFCAGTFATYQVTLEEITNASGVTFDLTVMAADDPGSRLRQQSNPIKSAWVGADRV